MDNMIEKIIAEWDKTNELYDSRNIEVVVELEEDGGDIYIGYHSRHNSFPTSEVICTKKDVDIDSLTERLDELDIDYWVID